MRRYWSRLGAALVVGSLAFVAAVPAGASTYAYLPVTGARSNSLTSSAAPGDYLRIWMTAGTTATESGIDSRSGQATAFLFRGCDPVDDTTCAYTATDGGQGTIASRVGSHPDTVSGFGTLQETTVTVTFTAFGEPQVGYECDFWLREWCGNVVYRSASVVATVTDPSFGLANVTFSGTGRVYLNNESSVDFAVG